LLATAVAPYTDNILKYRLCVSERRENLLQNSILKLAIDFIEVFDKCNTS